MHAFRICATLALAATLAACGDDDAASSSASTTSSTTAVGGMGATSSSTTTSANGGTSAAGGSGGASAGGSAAGGNATGGSTTTAAEVPCAGDTCTGGDVCCFDNQSTTQVRCDAFGACDANHIELSCNHPDDCPVNTTCCSRFNGTVLTMQCEATCDQADEYVMCSGPDQSACPAATSCSNAQAGTGYHYCAK